MRHGRLAALSLASALIFAGCSSDAASRQPDVSTGTDAAATNLLSFEATTLDGAAFSGETLAGKPAVLWFWAPWCVICRAEAPTVAGIADRFDGEVAFVGVPSLGNVADMQRFVDDTGVGFFPQVVDADGSVWASFGVISQPAFAFVASDGQIEVVVGSIPEQDLIARVEALVA